MNALLLAAALLLQDPSPVKGLLGRIDGKDAAASMRAIRDLADLDAKHRDEIRAGAAGLPEFYRDALLSELQSPAPPKFTLKREGLALKECFDELSRQSGLAFDYFAGPAVPGPIDVDLDGVSAFEALADICQKGQVSPWWIGYKKQFQTMSH